MRGRKNRQRLSISVDVPSGTDHLKINCDLRNASGMAWFDGFQLEEGACANDLNILQNADFSASGSWYTEEDNAANIQNGSVSCGGADNFSTLYTYANRSNSNATTNYVKTFTQKYGETQLLKYYYTFDERGNISHVSESDNQSNSFESFEYDFLNQLYIVVDKRNQTYMHFSYDDGGNITQVVKSNYDAGSNQPSTQIYCNTYTYDNVWKDKLVSFNNQAITYDAMGNPLQYRDGLSFTWKNGRQLATVTQNNETLAMTYDCNGLRTQKGGTHYYYDSDNNLIAMYDGTHTLFFYYDENGNATSFSLGGNMYFYVKNLQGDIINIVDSNGAVLVRYDYDVLGKIVNITDDSDPLITGVQNFALINPLRYRGYVYDDETGLYYLQSRYYDPVTGRFLNADVYVDTETGTPLSTNMFAYCENNMLYRIDETGRDACWIQAPNSVRVGWVFCCGHTSALFEEKQNHWWYFYWGPDSIQMLFLGVFSKKYLNRNIDRIIRIYNMVYPSLGIKNTDTYTEGIRFKGNFTSSIQNIIYWFRFYERYSKRKIYSLRFNPDISDNEYKRLLKSRHIINSISNSTHLNWFGKPRPESWIIKKNPCYDGFTQNCMHMSAYFLSYGSLYSSKSGTPKSFSKWMFKYYNIDKKISPNEVYVLLYDANIEKEFGGWFFYFS